MSRKKTIITYLVFFVCVGAFLTGGTMVWLQKGDQVKCVKVNIQIDKGSPYRFVSDSTVRQWITEDSIPVIGTRLKDLRITQIEENIKRQLYIDTVQVNSAMDGSLNIKVSQSIPLLRFKGDTGYDFYVDSAVKILPMQTHFRAPVPIISGSISFGFPPSYYGRLNDKNNEQDKQYLKKITSFVGYIYSDKFLRDFITQIYINQSGEIELVPLIGDQLIILGEVDDYVEKLEKLRKFYRNSFSEGWWATAKKINLKFKNQVVIS